MLSGDKYTLFPTSFSHFVTLFPTSFRCFNALFGTSFTEPDKILPEISHGYAVPFLSSPGAIKGNRRGKAPGFLRCRTLAYKSKLLTLAPVTQKRRTLCGVYCFDCIARRGRDSNSNANIVYTSLNHIITLYVFISKGI